MAKKDPRTKSQQVQDKLDELRSDLVKAQEFAKKYHLPTPERAKALQAKILSLESRADQLEKTPYDIVRLARHPKRPQGLDLAKQLIYPFEQLNGDRVIGDDQAIIIGIGKFRENRVAIIAQQTGHTWQEHQRHNRGTAGPIGYRKVLRLMKLADRFRLPILSFVSTKGARAFCDRGEENISTMIAECLAFSFVCRVPFIATIVGEGGSGGAIAAASADIVLIQQNAYYSVISPEGCAKILFEDESKASEMAKALCLTAQDTLELKIADEIIPEPTGGAHAHPQEANLIVGDVIERHLNHLRSLPVEQLLSRRRERFHAF